MRCADNHERLRCIWAISVRCFGRSCWAAGRHEGRHQRFSPSAQQMRKLVGVRTVWANSMRERDAAGCFYLLGAVLRCRGLQSSAFARHRGAHLSRHRKLAEIRSPPQCCMQIQASSVYSRLGSAKSAAAGGCGRLGMFGIASHAVHTAHSAQWPAWRVG